MQFVPKIEKFNSGDHRWLGSAHGVGDAQTATLDHEKFTDYTDFVPSGTPLKVGEQGLFEPVTAAGDTLAGFLLYDTNIKGANAVVAYVWHGRIRADRLPEKAFDVTTLTTPNPQFTIVKEA